MSKKSANRTINRQPPFKWGQEFEKIHPKYHDVTLRFLMEFVTFFYPKKPLLDSTFQTIVMQKYKDIRNYLSTILIPELISEINTITNDENIKNIFSLNSYQLSDLLSDIFFFLMDFFAAYYQNGLLRSIPPGNYNNANCNQSSEKDICFQWTNQDQYFIYEKHYYDDLVLPWNDISVRFLLTHDPLFRLNIDYKADQKSRHLLHNIKFDPESRQILLEFTRRPLFREERAQIRTILAKERLTKKVLREYNLNQIHQFIQESSKPPLPLSDFFASEENEISIPSLLSALETYYDLFTTRSSEEYYIHRNLAAYLLHKLDSYAKELLISKINAIKNISLPFKLNTEQNVNKYQISMLMVNLFQTTGEKVINFLQDFEKDLITAWENPKSPIVTDYLISLNQIPEDMISEIIKCPDQTDVWKTWLDFDIQNYILERKNKKKILKDFPHLMMDTTYLPKPLKSKILATLPQIDENLSGIILQSDNFHGLTYLQKEFHEKIDLCYIDPPYNTGSEEFLYMDGIKHSNWMNLMKSRMELLYTLLSTRGIFITSLDDNEYHHFRILGNEIFGEQNFIADILWHSTKSITNTALISQAHTHNAIYCKDIDFYKQNRKLFRLPEGGEGFDNPDADPRGPWKADPFQVGGWRPNQQYEIINPVTKESYHPNPGCSWKNDFKTYQKLIAENRIVFGKSGTSGPQRKRFLSEAISRGRVANTIWNDLDTTTNATTNLKKMFGVSPFNNPKPVSLIKRFLQLASAGDSWILDFFGGSASTAQAILEMNRDSNSKRRFIIIEKEQIFNTIIKPRLIKAIFSNYWNDGTPIFESDASLNSKEQKTCIKYIKIEKSPSYFRIFQNKI